MKNALLLLFAVLAVDGSFPQPGAAESATARKNFRAAELRFLNDIMATRSNDQSLYVLLGSGFLRAASFGDPKGFVSKWLAAHPTADVVVISYMPMTNTITRVRSEIIYIWIEDGAASLNVDLVAAGIFAGGTMYDMVDNMKGLDELLKKDPSLADARAQIEKERRAAPRDRPERVVSDGDYQARIARVADAERKARAKKLGLWSDMMKEDREAEGIE